MKIHLVLTIAFCLCFLAGCTGGYGEDRYRKKTISFLKLTPGAECVIPFELYNSNNKSQWIGIHPVIVGDENKSPYIRAKLSISNTGSIPMDIEVWSYDFPDYSLVLAPGEERVLSNEVLPGGLALKNVTGTPKGELKVKVLEVGDKPAGVEFYKVIGRGGM